ncbi:hypothetical protein AB0F88_02645 [Streptosporangium sp. NPDC023963]|uniref:hypothetical protein n=1 Tax=Streptosporangium sp. NPDC023963 TaxID=3155608 RepID=UPI003426C986
MGDTAANDTAGDVVGDTAVNGTAGDTAANDTAGDVVGDAAPAPAANFAETGEQTSVKTGRPIAKIAICPV